MTVDVTAVILAGGAGRRMGGVVKPLIEVDGIRILDRQLAVLAPRVAGVVVSANAAAWSPVPVIADPVEQGGPLAGIAGGLAAATTPWILAVAGDMPWLDGAVIDRILGVARAHAGTLAAVVPRVGGYPEPLLAAYHARARPAIEAAIGRGERSPSRVLLAGALEVHWIDERAGRCFTSVNRPADLG